MRVNKFFCFLFLCSTSFFSFGKTIVISADTIIERMGEYHGSKNECSPTPYTFDITSPISDPGDPVYEAVFHNEASRMSVDIRIKNSSSKLDEATLRMDSYDDFMNKDKHSIYLCAMNSLFNALEPDIPEKKRMALINKIIPSMKDDAVSSAFETNKLAYSIFNGYGGVWFTAEPAYGIIK